MSYYLYDNQQQTGPYSIEKLKSLWRSGSISGEAFYCEEGYSEWCPLRTLMEVEPSRKPSPFASTIPPIIAAVIPNKKPHSKVIVLSACLGCLVILFITLYLSGGSSSHDSNQAVLFIEGLGSIPVATDESALDDLTRYAQTGDNLSKESLLNSTRGFRVPNGTKVRFASGGLTSSKVEILQGPHKGEIVCVYSEWMRFDKSLAEYTSLRAIGAINRLPLATAQLIADHFELEYNIWDVPERVKGTDSFETAPFRSSVKILEKGALSSRIQLQEDSGILVGWIPNDWLENSEEPIKRRESEADKSAKQEADSFLGLTASQLRSKLGSPIKADHFPDPVDGIQIETLVFDSTVGKETFFVIEGEGGVVIDGEYHGVKLTPKYK